MVICKIRVSITKNGYATITNETHHLLTPELLERKWGIGLEKAKEMLKKITQEFISSDLLPLTRRYHIYSIPQLLSKLSCTFNTDMLFVNHKYIIENTSAQIFTDREVFPYVHTIKSHSQAERYLNEVTTDIGIPNTLISDNAGEYTVPEIDLQECIGFCLVDVRKTEPYSCW